MTKVAQRTVKTPTTVRQTTQMQKSYRARLAEKHGPTLTVKRGILGRLTGKGK
jgi:hypothetical protein